MSRRKFKRRGQRGLDFRRQSVRRTRACLTRLKVYKMPKRAFRRPRRASRWCIGMFSPAVVAPLACGQTRMHTGVQCATRSAIVMRKAPYNVANTLQPCTQLARMSYACPHHRGICTL